MPSKTQHIIRSSEPGFSHPEISVGAYIKTKIKQILSTEPNKIALIDAVTNEMVSYAQLDQLAEEVACSLLQLGIIASDRVMFFSDNNLEYFITATALSYLGVSTTPGTPANGAYETYNQLTRSKARILCVSKSKLPVLVQMMENPTYRLAIADLKLLVILNDDLVEERFRSNVMAPKQVTTFKSLASDGYGQQLFSVPYFPVEPSRDIHVIVYTSGTTGLPKGACHTHYSYVALLGQLLCIRWFRECRGSIFNLIFPFGHISGTLFLGATMANNMTAVVFDSMNTQKIVEGISKYRCKMALLFPELAVDLLENADYYQSCYDLSSVKVMLMGGTKYPKEVTTGLSYRFGAMLCEVYGATEMMGAVANNGDVFESGNVGSPLANIEMKIVDMTDGQTCAAYQEGEICFRGPSCFIGYLDNQEATGSTIDADGWYHSGDLGYYDYRNCLFITDRIKELIKYKHWSIAPQEIENFLQSHPAVASACVIGVKHESEGQHLRAYVELFRGKLITEQEIVQFVQDNMGYQKRLNGGVYFISKIPRTVIGKVDRQFFKNQIQSEILTEKAALD